VIRVSSDLATVGADTVVHVVLVDSPVKRLSTSVNQCSMGDPILSPPMSARSCQSPGRARFSERGLCVCFDPIGNNRHRDTSPSYIVVIVQGLHAGPLIRHTGERLQRQRTIGLLCVHI
jgi:hypothetical protein